MNREPSRPKRTFTPLWIAALLVLAVIVGTGAVLRSLPGSTVILVRHAEKQSGSDDPLLTPEGAARAERLATMLGDQGGTPVVRIFSSEARRTQETAGPLARKLGLPVTVVAAKDTGGLVSQVRGASREGTSVVVGHSNTVPRLVSELTGGRVVPAISDDDFGSMFVVHVPSVGPPSVVRLRY